MVSHFFNVEQMCRDVRREAKNESERKGESVRKRRVKGCKRQRVDLEIWWWWWWKGSHIGWKNSVPDRQGRKRRGGWWRPSRSSGGSKNEEKEEECKTSQWSEG